MPHAARTLRLVWLTLSLALTLLIVTLAAAAESDLRYETEDWIFTAPASLGSTEDLALIGQLVQVCSDDIELLVGRRPTNVRKFTMSWIIDGRAVAWAFSTGVENHVPDAAFRIVTPNARQFFEDMLRRRLCFGPHEVTHVLTWESWGPLWANEGLATFTDRLYGGPGWRCCESPQTLDFSCDASGYVYGLEPHAYSDLSPFVVDFPSYMTAACFWHEIYARGGFPAIRGILASMRSRRPLTTGEFVLHHVNRVLNRDLRPVAARYGFEPAELAASLVPRIPGCTLIGMSTRDVIRGTSGPDVVCGLGGNDWLTGGPAADVLDGGSGADRLDARDGRRDVVRGGPGKDSARVDRGLDRVSGVERLLP
jgi:RTX calcium-binding nonapeptide repeat (4 copies)